jgi:hypothetical protein
MYAVRAFADSSGVGSALRAKDENELGVEEVWLILVFPGIKATVEPICVPIATQAANMALACV